MMTMQSAITAVIICACFLVSLACDSDGVKFGYTGIVGPDHWGSLSPNFTLCSEGVHQSPIDIMKDAVVYSPKLESLMRDYIAANATLNDNVYNIALRYNDTAGTVTVDGKKYKLKQMHWHSPSEHTINGERFPVELHMVHSSDDGNITVVAVLYRYGRPDPFLFQIKDKLTELYTEGCKAEKGTPVPVGVLNMRALRRRTRKYFRYVGSLTTPPCTENVIWNILGKVREMAQEQAAALAAPLDEGYKHNCRPTQPLNGRTVLLYDASRRIDKSI